MTILPEPAATPLSPPRDPRNCSPRAWKRAFETKRRFVTGASNRAAAAPVEPADD
ncbi:hypothetical protein [Oceanibacterium hippocampi]|uniref:Uncharacterized protein n=1 Tax=Oceanibacterium hippocampi TaxID=745714 RepID=A0A1Y5T3J7_9PROT|nr:hypothetical protein [Oceanibacterium hippocampi]SLN54945.1 hypothetical protein OCH7691_02349 [Oceanibacterium hippocampi]